MIMVALLSLITGIVLGMRFKVLILVPAIAFVVPIAFGFGIVHHHAFGPAVLAAVAALASLQIGYFVGIPFRNSLAAVRISGLRNASLTRSHTTRRTAH
jgi:hypothetical protein